MGEMERPPHDPARMRIGDKERNQVAELLQRAAGDGRLDFDELEERLEATWSAKTYGDLVPITADLPTLASSDAMAVPSSSAPVFDTHAPAPASSIAVMSGIDRKGVWTVGERHTALAVMGGINIDLRQVQFTSRDVTIYAHAVMGAVDVTVNARTKVVVDGVGLMGAFEQGRDKVDPAYDADSPVVRVTGLALMGAVSVTRKRMPGEPRPRRGILGR